MHILRARPRGILYVRSRLVRKPQQTAYQFSIWPLTTGILLVKLVKRNISRKWGVLASGHAKLVDHLFGEMRL